MNKVPTGFLSSHEPMRTEEEYRASLKAKPIFVNFYQHWSEDGRMGGQTCEPFTDQVKAMDDARYAYGRISYLHTVVLFADGTWQRHQYAPEGE